ncbi:hypothetical protein M758_10G115300 [Ceratodon purpureus]|nr:hypothetical protein M758_10G115300 [Ceratodon purpureus]
MWYVRILVSCQSTSVLSFLLVLGTPASHSAPLCSPFGLLCDLHAQPEGLPEKETQEPPRCFVHFISTSCFLLRGDSFPVPKSCMRQTGPSIIILLNSQRSTLGEFLLDFILLMTDCLSPLLGSSESCGFSVSTAALFTDAPALPRIVEARAFS